jgi:hypothetical protein
MSDVERWHEWTPSIRSVKRLDRGPFQVGSRAIVRQPKLPPALWTVTDVQPERSFTWANRGPGILVTGRHAIVPSSAGSRVTLSVTFEGLFGTLLGRLTRRLTEQYLDLEANGLKRRSENG